MGYNVDPCKQVFNGREGLFSNLDEKNAMAEKASARANVQGQVKGFLA